MTLLFFEIEKLELTIEKSTIKSLKFENSILKIPFIHPLLKKQKTIKMHGISFSHSPMLDG